MYEIHTGVNSGGFYWSLGVSGPACGTERSGSKTGILRRREVYFLPPKTLDFGPWKDRFTVCPTKIAGHLTKTDLYGAISSKSVSKDILDPAWVVVSVVVRTQTSRTSVSFRYVFTDRDPRPHLVTRAPLGTLSQTRQKWHFCDDHVCIRTFLAPSLL